VCGHKDRGTDVEQQKRFCFFSPEREGVATDTGPSRKQWGGIEKENMKKDWLGLLSVSPSLQCLLLNPNDHTFFKMK